MNLPEEIWKQLPIKSTKSKIMTISTEAQMGQLFHLSNQSIVSCNLNFTVWDFLCCLKSKTLCICCFFQTSSSTRLLRNIRELGAKAYFTDTPNTIDGFRDSGPVPKMHHCYWKIKISNISFLTIQAMQAITISRWKQTTSKSF